MLLFQDIENIFSNSVDIQSLTYNLLSSLEDTKEMCEETDIPLVGACFEDIAEVSTNVVVPLVCINRI